MGTAAPDHLAAVPHGAVHLLGEERDVRRTLVGMATPGHPAPVPHEVVHLLGEDRDE